MARTEEYKGYTITIKDIERDWSECAVEYSVNGTSIKDECEDHRAIEYAREDIDKL